MLKMMKFTSAYAKSDINNISMNGMVRKQRGFNVIEFLMFAAFLVLLGLMFIPNLNLFLGVDKKIASANLEAANVRAAAVSYEINNQGKYPADSDVLLNAGNYIAPPRAFYTFDTGTGRITSAAVDTAEHIPSDPWNGIKWDPSTDTWIKQ
jgi:competence protein ComGC